MHIYIFFFFFFFFLDLCLSGKSRKERFFLVGLFIPKPSTQWMVSKYLASSFRPGCSEQPRVGCAWCCVVGGLTVSGALQLHRVEEVAPWGAARGRPPPAGDHPLQSSAVPFAVDCEAGS